ncbi:uncharacterized protein [Littorina saxatilis]
MWLHSVTLLLVTECVLPVFGLSLTNCGGSSNDKTAEVVRCENSSFTCTLDSAESTHTLQWTVTTAGNDQFAGTCPPPSNGDSCNNKSLRPYFTPSRTESTRSVMTVDPTKANLVTDVESGTLVCKDLDNSQQDSCPMDYITRASGTCSSRVVTVTTPWTVTGDCSITQGNSSRGRYRCQWFINIDDTSEVAVTNMDAMTSNTLPGGSARCPFSIYLPDRNGRYTYRVKFLPGRQFFPAGTFQFSRPTTPTIVCTPTGHVTENSTVTCTCTTDNVGQPEGRLRWLRGSSDVIDSGAPGVDRLELRQTLSRSDDGVTQFRCRLDWSNVTMTSSVYTASVGYPPSTSELTISPSATGGPVAVSENTTVSFTCRATGGNPSTTMTLSDATSTLQSGPSPLTFDLPAARCEHSGVYTCTGSNGYGRDVIDTTSLCVLCDGETQGQIERGDDTSYFSVAVGLGVVLALLVTVNVVVVVWLWRRQWNLPWAEKQQQGQESKTSSPVVNVRNATPSTLSSTGEYSSLEMSDVGLRSIYSGPTSISDTETSDVSRTSAVYENTQR